MTFASEEESLEVEYFWAGKSELGALNVIKKEYSKYGGTWLATPMESYEKLQEDLIQRFYQGIPPSAFQWQGNLNSLKSFIEMGVIREITKEFMEEVSLATLPTYVFDSISFDGKIYGLPVGIYCDNSAIYSGHIWEVGKIFALILMIKLSPQDVIEYYSTNSQKLFRVKNS